MTIALCNSCLRVREFDSYEDACKANCECGAENGDYVSSAYCPCESCAAVARVLKEYEGDQVALKAAFSTNYFSGPVPEVFSWTAAGGLVTGDPNK